MGMQNAKALKNALRIFYLEQGREPTMEEFKDLVTGNTKGKKANETETNTRQETTQA